MYRAGKWQKSAPIPKAAEILLLRDRSGAGQVRPIGITMLCFPCRHCNQQCASTLSHTTETESQLLVTLLAGVHIYNRIIGSRKEASHYKAPQCLHSFYGSGWHHPSAGGGKKSVYKITAVLKTEMTASCRGCSFQCSDGVLFFVSAVVSAKRGRG